MKKLLSTIVFAVIAMTGQAQPLLRTHIETGDVEGHLDGSVAVYKAIPYAAAPVGDLRWKAPQPAKPWKGVLKAEDVAKWPPQPEKSYVKYDMMSEDCLYLSVATPAKTAKEALPVMVFIHGGAFRTEHYGGDLWQSLARRGVVAVSIEGQLRHSRSDIRSSVGAAQHQELWWRPIKGYHLRRVGRCHELPYPVCLTSGQRFVPRLHQSERSHDEPHELY